MFDCTDVYISIHSKYNIVVNQPNDLEWHSLKMSTQISSRLVDPRDIIMFRCFVQKFSLFFFVCIAEIPPARVIIIYGN